MQAATDTQRVLPVFESPSNLFILMELFEEFVHLCHLNQISFWIDWGTALGAIRHSNIIPWDIDCDLCFTRDNYEKMLKLFEKHNYTIGNLICDPDGYDDRHGCCWIQSKKYKHLGVDIFGIDCVSHDVGETITKTLMSQKIIEAYPVTPASYDFSNQDLFPLQWIPLVGNYVLTSYQSLERVKLCYGEHSYLEYPMDEYNQWLKYNSNKLFLLQSPFKTVAQVSQMIDGLSLGTPFLIKNSTEFILDDEELKKAFINEQEILAWYETKDDIFTEYISKDAQNIIHQWENDTLTFNIIDSPCSHYQFLPKALLNRIDNLGQDVRPHALCYLLTNKNTLTKFHCDHGGGGWLYLKQGKKLWWFIAPEDQEILRQANYLLEHIRELSFTELVFLHNHFLWGKIYIVLQAAGDLIYFPENWAHRVVTYDRAFGIGGYVK